MALVAAPVALAQTTEKAQQPKPAAAAKPAPKAAAATDPAKAGKVEGAAAVRTTPADLKKGTEKSDDGCGHGKMAASDA
jgi:hypothetical protein